MKQAGPLRRSSGFTHFHFSAQSRRLALPPRRRLAGGSAPAGSPPLLTNGDFQNAFPDQAAATAAVCRRAAHVNHETLESSSHRRACPERAGLAPTPMLLGQPVWVWSVGPPAGRASAPAPCAWVWSGSAAPGSRARRRRLFASSGSHSEPLSLLPFSFQSLSPYVGRGLGRLLGRKLSQACPGLGLRMRPHAWSGLHSNGLRSA